MEKDSETKPFTRWDGKYCPDCSSKLKINNQQKHYQCLKCEIDFFDNEIKIKFQKSVVVGVTKTGKLVHRVMPDPMRGYKPPKLRKLEEYDND